MSAPAFTPGPWSYWHDRCDACKSSGEAEFMIDGPPGGYHGQFSKEADARLIAAAPEMFDLLATHPAYAADTTFAEIWKWLERKDAVLRKARGEP